MFLDQIFPWKTAEESTDKTAEGILVAYIMVKKKKKRNPSGIHEDSSLNPGLNQRVKDLMLPWAAV